MGVGVGKMCPEWLKGGRWPTGAMCPARAAALKGDAFSCMHLDSSSKHSAPFLFFLDLLDIFRFRVWMPSFFMVSGLFTWGQPRSFQWVELPSESENPTPSSHGGPHFQRPTAHHGLLTSTAAILRKVLFTAWGCPAACRAFGLRNASAAPLIEPHRQTPPQSRDTAFLDPPAPAPPILPASLPPLWEALLALRAASQAKPRWRLPPRPLLAAQSAAVPREGGRARQGGLTLCSL